MSTTTSLPKSVDSSLNQNKSQIVASHYNKLEEKGLEARKESRIYYMRNFNNWTKSVIIANMLDRIREKRGYDCKINVLDIGCGKGGDLLKYKIGKISHIVCADIAETSLEQCKDRYKQLESKNYRNERLFTAEFIPADCTRIRLKDKYKHNSIMFDLVSVQFSFHYCFESLAQAECMIRNASESLRPGGYFIGTTPDSYEIIRRLRSSQSNKFGNDVYSITFDEKYADKNTPIPLFGCEYNFHLQDVVDCPEFLVHFPTLVEICRKYDLQLLFRKRFDQYFQESKNNENIRLLTRMDALESYPSNKLMGDQSQYQHAKDYIYEMRLNNDKQIGTLSQSEWDVISLYIVFAFTKMEKGTSNPDKKQRIY